MIEISWFKHNKYDFISWGHVPVQRQCCPFLVYSFQYLADFTILIDDDVVIRQLFELTVVR